MHLAGQNIECLIEKYVIWDTPELFNKGKTWLNYINFQGKVPSVIKVKSVGLARMKQRRNTLTLNPSSSTVKQSLVLMNNSLRREIPVT